MSLFNGEPLTEAEVRARLVIRTDGPTIRKISATGKVYTVRHKPWHELVGEGPPGYQCADCHWLRTQRAAAIYFKCGRQLITRGPGTDIRAFDDACRLFHIRGVSMFSIKTCD